MVAVTDIAKQTLKDILSTNTDDPEVAIRLTFNPPGEFGIVLDKEAEGDQVVEHEGTKTLLVAPEVATMVEGITLDVKDTAEGPRLVMSKEQRPQE